MPAVRLFVRYVFCDIDGVMNPGGCAELTVAPPCAALLSALAEACSAQVVVTSSHRVFLSLDQIRAAFAQAGFSGRVAGVTPLCMSREREVLSWLEDHPGSDEFVVLDDAEDMGSLSSRLVRVGPRGLEASHVSAALSLMQQQTGSA